MRGKNLVVLITLVVLSLAVISCAVTSSEVKDSRGKKAGDYKYLVTYNPPEGRSVFYYTDEEPTVEGDDRVIKNYRQEGWLRIEVHEGTETRVPVEHSTVTQQK